ncbi:MAG: hypothetical protein HKP27_08290 [Myxococcales bacterium]|nr:hypothetical protein [Myxococcales bacterium]
MSEAETTSPAELSSRLAAIGRQLAEREAAHREALSEAHRQAAELHADVTRALAAYNREVEAAGAPQLRVAQSSLRPDDKHLRSVQFELARGRHRAVVTVKSRGDVTLVGPFRLGKIEGPCKSFPFDSREELTSALTAFLESFLEEAATP